MDERSKRRLRRAAKWLYKIAVILLVLLLALRIAYPSFLSRFGPYMIDAITKSSLRKASQIFFNVHYDFAFGRIDKIASFLPPKDEAGLADWGRSVADFMDQPSGVFYYDGKDVKWPVAPDAFPDMQGRIDTLLRSGITCTHAAPQVHKLGTMYVQRASFDSVTSTPSDQSRTYYTTAIIAAPESPARWGAIFNSKESIYPFLRRLRNLSPSEFIYASDLRIMQSCFYLQRRADDVGKDSVMTYLYGLRVYQNDSDSLLYSTPDLDTTNFKIEERFSSTPFWFEVYESDFGQRDRKEILDVFDDPFEIPWGGYAIDVFLIIVLTFLYRGILKLTRPEQTHPAGE